MPDHPSYCRLTIAAAERWPPITGPSALAAELNEAPQVVTNWSTRGVSTRGAIAAQKKLGISAVWILDGEGPERVGAADSQSQPVRYDDGTMDAAIELLYLMADARPDDPRFARPTWAMIKVAAKILAQGDGSTGKAMQAVMQEIQQGG